MQKIESGESGLSWHDTLVIITSDHETGFILFEKKDDLNSLKYHSFDHTNELVYLFAKGVESANYRSKKPYIDNTKILHKILEERKK